ncbi:MAG TPA: cytochrome c [Alphaproteobacteria bacterium]|jgi:cytochrome c556
MKPWIVLSSFLAAGALMLGLAMVPQHVGAAEEVLVAQASATGASKRRLALMREMSKTRKALTASAKAGKIGPGDVARGERIAAITQELGGLWPEGSGSDKIKTRAKPEIWKDMGKFRQNLEGIQKAAADGAAAAKAGDAAGVGKAMGAMNCGGCHKPFRGPKPK